MKVVLFLKGHAFAEKEVEIKEFPLPWVIDDDVRFRRRVLANEALVEKAVEKIKERYLHQIIKCKNEYEIFLIVESKMNEEVKEDEFFR